MNPSIQSKLVVVILAAGQGKRMKSEEPKALTLLQGKPFISHILETLEKLDKDIKPIIVVGYKKERIKEVLGANHTYALQSEQLGTGHALMSSKSGIEDEHDLVLVLAADQPLVSRETLERLINKHEEKKPTITLGTVVVPDFDDWRAGLYTNFGRIIRDENGRVRGIREFKDTNEAEREIQELSVGQYIFEAKWLWENINSIKNDNAQAEYYINDLVKIANEQAKEIETIEVANTLEALHPNSKEELEVLEKLVV